MLESFDNPDFMSRVEGKSMFGGEQSIAPGPATFSKMGNSPRTVADNRNPYSIAPMSKVGTESGRIG